MIRWGLVALFGTLVFAVDGREGQASAALALMALFGALCVVVKASGMLGAIAGDRDAVALAHLPVSDLTILRWSVSKYLWRSHVLLLAFVAGFGALALRHELPISRWWTVPAVAALAWALTLVGAGWCALLLPHALLGYAALAFVLGSVVLVIAESRFRFAEELLQRIAPQVLVFLPTGWPAAVFGAVLPAGSPSALVLLLPIGVVLATVASVWKRLQTGFALDEHALVGREIGPDDALERELANGHRELETSPSSPSASVTGGAIRGFLDEPRWDRRGRLEALLQRWLTPRERSLSGFAFPEGHTLTGPWLRILRDAATISIGALAAGLVAPAVTVWILVAGLVITGVRGLFHLLNTGSAFVASTSGGMNVPVHAWLGIGYRELARLLMKRSAVQWPFVLAFTTVWSLAAAVAFELPLPACAAFAFKASLLPLALRPVQILFGFSGGSNDSDRIRPVTLVLIAVVVGGGLALAVLAVASLFPGALGWGAWVLAPFGSYGMFRVYGWFYDQSRFDLVRVVPGGSDTALSRMLES